jgi:steroid delta-isomerase-like uncharacterized protein
VSTDQNKAVVRRVLDEVWNQGKLALIDELFASDYRRHGVPSGTPAGPAGERQHRATFRAAFPDLVITAEDMIAEGDRVAVRYTWRGTYEGTWPDVPGAGQAVTMSGIAIHRVADGRVTDLWVVGDELGLLRQLGALPTRDASLASAREHQA